MDVAQKLEILAGAAKVDERDAEQLKPRLISAARRESAQLALFA
jgi:hypothetical protein